MKRGFGTDGYRHLRNAVSLWGPNADRFAGAILLSEILGWHDQSIRDTAGAEHYFDQAELHHPANTRYIFLKQILRQRSRILESFLERAWDSKRLSSCPSMQEWELAIQNISPGGIPVIRLGPPGQKVEWGEEITPSIRKPTAPTVEWGPEVQPTPRPAKQDSDNIRSSPPSLYETRGTVVKDLWGKPLLGGKRFYTDANGLSDLWVDLKADGYNVSVGEILSLKLARTPGRSYFYVNKKGGLDLLPIGRAEGLIEKSKIKKKNQS